MEFFPGNIVIDSCSPDKTDGWIWRWNCGMYFGVLYRRVLDIIVVDIWVSFYILLWNVLHKGKGSIRKNENRTSVSSFSAYGNGGDAGCQIENGKRLWL